MQTLRSTDYDYWATRRERYGSGKKHVAQSVLGAIERQLPGVSAAVKMIDVATPLTYWRTARSWRGAYEGWKPNRESMFGHVARRVTGLSNF